MPRSPIGRLRRLCLALPDAHEVLARGEPTFRVRNRMFASFASADNHHGAGRYAVWCKAVHVTQDALVRLDPDRFFVPPYMGVSGWLGIYLDERTDWQDVAIRLREAYRLVAPKRLLAALDEPRSHGSPGRSGRPPGGHA